jgi:demethylmenaquinone methyltransferase/2-methoxy-6-polyprenyl-1,4-benzoquinol methylase
MLARARTRLGERGLADGVTLLEGDGTRLPFGSRSFDILFASFTLELFDTPEIETALAEARRVLRKGGHICVVDLARGRRGPLVRLYEWVHDHLPRYVDCRPIYPERALQEAGFEILEVRRGSMWGLPVKIVLGKGP